MNLVLGSEAHANDDEKLALDFGDQTCYEKPTLDDEVRIDDEKPTLKAEARIADEKLVSNTGAKSSVEEDVLNRTARLGQKGFGWEAGPRHAELAIQELGLTTARPHI